MQDHRPRKRFGQNFLHDPHVIDRIVHAIVPRADDRVVEIGPGLGALTAPLLRALGQLDVVEIDRDLAARLPARFADSGELRVHVGDALRFDFCAIADGAPLRVVGNLPYNISTPLIFHLLDQAGCIRDMHFMLQKEVVERMAAAPGSDAYGRLSVMVQQRCRVESLFNVAPGAFHPPPKVWSAIVRLTPWAAPPVPVADPVLFGRLVTQAFSQRRKTLRNAVKGYLDGDAIAALGIDPQRRPETLSVAEFAALAAAAGERG